MAQPRTSPAPATQTPAGATENADERASPPQGDRWTVGELLSWTTARFEQAGIETPRVDAEYLLAHALGCARLDLYLQHDRLLDDAARSPFRALVRRRLDHEPVAHLRGLRGFHAIDLELEVDRRALVPRPETELLVDWLLEELPAAPGVAVLDVGTGSGAIALAIKHVRADVALLATDLSEDALVLARANATRLQLPVEFAQADLIAELPARGLVPPGGFQAIAANLPYVAHDDLDTLPPEVRCHEPLLALDGGGDGLDVIRRLVEQATAAAVLAPGGRLYLEIGHGQAPAVKDVLVRAGWSEVVVREDLAGIARIVAASRPGSAG